MMIDIIIVILLFHLILMLVKKILIFNKNHNSRDKIKEWIIIMLIEMKVLLNRH